MWGRRRAGYRSGCDAHLDVLPNTPAVIHRNGSAIVHSVVHHNGHAVIHRNGFTVVHRNADTIRHEHGHVDFNPDTIR